MKAFTSSPFLTVTIIAIQLLGPVGLWAAEQRGIRVEANRQIIVSAVNGDQLTLQRVNGPSPLKFRDMVPEDGRITTGTGTTAELLLSNRAVLALDAGTTAQVRMGSTDQTTIQVTTGAVRLSTAASALGSQGVVTVQTPTVQIQTRGGILRVAVDRPAGKAQHPPNGTQVYRASYTPELLMAAAPQSDLIQVEEGTAELPGLGPTGGLLTVKAGQRVMVQAGRAGSPTEAGSLGAGTTGIPAITGHALTPKEGRDYLVALQVDQATKLGQALTGAAETGQKDSEKKNDTKNVINGATGGVSLQSNLVSALFGNGSAANPAASTSQDRSGTGYGGHNNNGFTGFDGAIGLTVKANGSDQALLVFTRRDPIAVEIQEVTDTEGNLLSRAIAKRDQSGNIIPGSPIASSFDGTKELVLVGGKSNVGHGGTAPTETLLVRGVTTTNVAILPSDFVSGGGTTTDPVVVNANSTFVVNTSSITNGTTALDHTITGGTLSMFSSQEGDNPLVLDDTDQQGKSFVDGAITATGDNVVLKGGVTLDQKTTATIGTTAATDTYFKGLTRDLGRTFSGSVLSVIDGPSGRTSLTMQDRMLGVYDGSTISGGDPTCKEQACNKALLSVLDAKLKGPSGSIPLIDIAAGTHFDRDGKATPGKEPNVTVTSALVTRSTNQLDSNPLDNKLLEASAPLFALTQANMTTTSHFADLAGNQAQSLNLNGALVALSASKLVIDSGHLLNLNNATAAITGYLFSLNNGSTLQISNGSLFSLNGTSSLTLNGNAFGVFGNGTNTLKLDNNLCGAGAACGALVNSAGQAITLQDGTALKVAGVTQNVVLPNGFNVFAQAPNAGPAHVQIDANDALFKVDGTSTLTINGTRVK